MTAEQPVPKKSLTMVDCGTCGSKAFIPSDLAPLEFTPCTKCEADIMMPMMLRQFKLIRPIASGGMGTVYRALDTSLNREVAVKLMKDELLNDEEAVESFSVEARACASLSHTNIIHIYTFDEHQGKRYLVMEIADNGCLDSLIEKEGMVTELDILDMGIKVAAALDSALQKGLLHRDIKPSNILFNQEGEPKLVDFGLATNSLEDTNYHGTIWGTPYYIAPEKVNREAETFLSDMYSLAGTLYHGLTGHVPFEAPTIEEVVAAQIHTPLTPPNHVVPSTTQNTSDAIYRAMAKDPAHRYQNYSEFIMALESARSQLLISMYNT
ncbi:MAG: Serine/threonine-protein kinase PrkC [Verrucomicrobia subdivision 3 bacterium]|nr:Serine/threonine-protein kinase PrkC [Limisphaerales bacterium]MCS1415150.1 Serine/threonine-protein kinase PrkC [Limisphaerales bacterium]